MKALICYHNGMECKQAGTETCGEHENYFAGGAGFGTPPPRRLQSGEPGPSSSAPPAAGDISRCARILCSPCLLQSGGARRF